jgi:hypothetical protein
LFTVFEEWSTKGKGLRRKENRVLLGS